MRKILLFVGLVIVLLSGCANSDTKEPTVDSQSLTSEAVSDNEASSVEPTEDEKISPLKWTGNWVAGNMDELGSEANLNVTTEGENEFSFALDALAENWIKDENGALLLCPNTGYIEGVATIETEGVAYFITEEYNDYKIVFKLVEKDKLIIEEVNSETNEDYGFSPFAGDKVRFSGEYTKED